jgi:asparagine synthetase A
LPCFTRLSLPFLLHVFAIQVSAHHYYYYYHIFKQFREIINASLVACVAQLRTRGRIEYFFKTFGAVAVLCIEMKLKVGNDDDERF